MADPIKVRDLTPLDASAVSGEENLYYEKEDGTFGRVKVSSLNRTTWNFSYTYGTSIRPRYFEATSVGANNQIGRAYQAVAVPELISASPTADSVVGTAGTPFVVAAGKKLYLEKMAYGLSLGFGNTSSVGRVALTSSSGAASTTSAVMFDTGGLVGMTYYTNRVLFDNSTSSTSRTIFVNPSIIYRGTIFVYNFSVQGEVSIR